MLRVRRCLHLSFLDPLVAMLGRWRIVRLLIGRVELEARDEKGNTPLHLACEHGHFVVGGPVDLRVALLTR